jgi:hypothetical protein
VSILPERQPSKREIVETELRRIWDERAELTVVGVLDAARPQESLLHDHFEWDDSVAGENYRLIQAAMLIRSVKIRFTQVDARGHVSDYSVRAWQAARYTDNGDVGSYIPVEAVREDPQRRELLIRQMARDAEAFRRRYAHLEEFTRVVRGLLESDVEAPA